MEQQILHDIMMIETGRQQQVASMIISAQERQWALELKQAVQDNCEELFDDHSSSSSWNLSDMEYAKHAIIAGGNVPKALKRIQGQYLFFKEYGINHSLEQIVFYFKLFLEQQPGYVLHLDVDAAATQEAVLVIDASAFDPALVLTPCSQNVNRDPDYNWKINAIGYYYLHYIIQPSFASIRQGVFAVVECEGLGWDNFNIEYDNRLHAEMFGTLPVKYKVILCYNTSVVANLVFNLVKPIMPQSMKESLHLGCSVFDADGSTATTRLSELFLQPSLETVQMKLVDRAITLLAMKDSNDRKFRL